MTRKPRDVRNPAILEAAVRDLAGRHPEYVVHEPPPVVTLPDGTRVLAVRAQPKVRRPPGLTDFRDEDRLAETIRAMLRDKAKITRATLAARLGITESALRGYLKSTGRTKEQIVIQYSPR